MDIYLIELIYQYKREQWRQEAAQIRLASLIRAQNTKAPSKLRLLIADWLISEGMRLKSGAEPAQATIICRGETL